MGKVILVFKVLPEDMKMFDRIKEEIAKLKPERIEEDPIAFGLKALQLTFIVPDEGGVQDKLENKIRAVKGVSDLEVLRASRSL